MRPPTEQSWLGRALPIAVGALGLGLFFYPELLSGFRRMQWDIGDTRLLNLVLEQSFRWARGLVSGAMTPLWNPPYFFPALNVAGYTDVFLGEAPIYWLARASGLTMDTAMQVFMIAVAALNFGVAYLWLNRALKFAPAPAALGAFLFAYGYPRGVQVGHPALQPQFPMLLALWGLWATFGIGADSNGLRAPAMGARKLAWTRADGAIAAIFAGIALQLLTGFYLGWFLVFGLGIAGIATVLEVRRWRIFLAVLRRQWLVAAVCATATALLLAPMMLHYLEAARTVGLRPFNAILPPRIQAWFYLGPESWLYRWQDLLKGFRMLDYGPEQKIGVGFATTVFVGLGWRRIWRKAGPGSALRLLGIVSLTLFVLCTEFWPGLGLWRLVYEVIPGAKAIRAVSRIGLVMLVPAAVGLAAFAEGVLEKKKRSRVGVAALLLAVVVLEQGHRADSFDKLELRDEVAQLGAEVDPSSCRFFFYSPRTDGSEPEYRYQIDAMWAAYATGIPTLNGYSGNAPPAWHLGGSELKTADDEKRLAGALADWMREHGLDPAGLCWIQADATRK